MNQKCVKRCEKAKKVGITEQDMTLSPQNEEKFYWNFANP